MLLSNNEINDESMIKRAFKELDSCRLFFPFIDSPRNFIKLNKFHKINYNYILILYKVFYQNR